MTDPFYITLAPAEASVGAGVLAKAAPVASDPDSPAVALRYAAFDMETPLVEDGVLTDTPANGALARSVAGVGLFEYSERLTDPLALATGATARWVPLEATYVPGVSWVPYEGSAAYQWLTSPEHAPVLDADYVYERDRDEVYRQAMIFNTSSWMTLSTDAFAPSSTLVVVAVLNAGFGRHYGVLETKPPAAVADPDDPNAPPLAPDHFGFGLRYSHGTVQVWSGSPVISHEAAATFARPVVLAMSLDSASGRLLVADRNRSSRTFSTKGFGLDDVLLYLGREGGGFDKTTNAAMDLLEVLYFDRLLNFDELESLVTDLDAAYGVS